MFKCFLIKEQGIFFWNNENLKISIKYTSGKFVRFFSKKKTVKSNLTKKKLTVIGKSPAFSVGVPLEVQKKENLLFEKFIQNKSSFQQRKFREWKQEITKPRPFLTWRIIKKKKYFVYLRNIRYVVKKQTFFHPKDPRFFFSLKERKQLFSIFPRLKYKFFIKPRRYLRRFFIRKRLPRELFKKYMTKLRYYRFQVRQNVRLKQFFYQFKMLTFFFLHYTNIGTSKVFVLLKKQINQWFWSSLSRYLNIEYFFFFQLYNFVRNLFIFFEFNYYKRLKFFQIKRLINFGFLKVNRLVILFSYFQIFLYDLVELSYKKIFLHWRFLKKKKFLIKKNLDRKKYKKKTNVFYWSMERRQISPITGLLVGKKKFFVLLFLVGFLFRLKFSLIRQNYSRFFKFMQIYTKWLNPKSQVFLLFYQFYKFFFRRNLLLQGVEMNPLFVFMQRFVNVGVKKKTKRLARFIHSLFLRLYKRKLKYFPMLIQKTFYHHFRFLKFLRRFSWIRRFPLLLRGLVAYFNRRFIFSFHFKRRNKKMFLFLQRYLRRFLRVPAKKNYQMLRQFSFIWSCFSFKTMSLIPFYFQWHVVRFFSKSMRRADLTFLSRSDLKRFRRYAARNRYVDQQWAGGKFFIFHFLFRSGRKEERKFFRKQRLQYSLFEKSFLFFLPRSKLQLVFFQNLYQ